LKLFAKLFCRLVYFVAIWYIFYNFGKLYQEKSVTKNALTSTENATTVKKNVTVSKNATTVTKMVQL
jgi:hypothetical protein